MKNVKLRHTNIRDLVSSDEIRPAMHGVYLDTELSILVITNGYLIALYDVDLHDDDESGIIPVSAFNYNGIQPLAKHNREGMDIRVKNGVATSIGDDGSKTVPLIDHVYPSYRSVITRKPVDNTKGSDDIYGMNLGLLSWISKGIPSKNKAVRVKRGPESQRFFLVPIADDLDHTCYFIAMEIGLEAEEDPQEIIRAKVNPESVWA